MEKPSENEMSSVWMTMQHPDVLSDREEKICRVVADLNNVRVADVRDRLIEHRANNTYPFSILSGFWHKNRSDFFPDSIPGPELEIAVGTYRILTWFEQKATMAIDKWRDEERKKKKIKDASKTDNKIDTVGGIGGELAGACLFNVYPSGCLAGCIPEGGKDDGDCLVSFGGRMFVIDFKSTKLHTGRCNSPMWKKVEAIDVFVFMTGSIQYRDFAYRGAISREELIQKKNFGDMGFHGSPGYRVPSDQLSPIATVLGDLAGRVCEPAL